MPAAVIASLLYTGTARGGFQPPDQPFSVIREIILGALRITVNGQHTGRIHETSIHVAHENGNFVNSAYPDVTDDEPTISSFRSQLSRLVTGRKYKLEIDVSKFDQEGEEVAVTIELLELDTTLAYVTKNVLMDAEKELGISAITFGVSEATFSTLMTKPFTAPQIKVGHTAGINMRLNIEWDDYPPWPYVQLDVESKHFVIHGGLVLEFYAVDGGKFPEAVAGVRATLEIRCHPAMVTSTEDTLQLQFDSAAFSDLVVSVHDDTAILHEFPTGFKAAVDAYVHQIVSRTGTLGFALPAYLQSRAMPDYWHRVFNMELAFRRFDYREITVHGFTISYLFVIFSVRGLDLPLPYYCENEWGAIREANTASAAVQEVTAPATSAEDVQTLATSVQDSAAHEGRRPPAMGGSLAPNPAAFPVVESGQFPTAPYFNIIVAAEISSMNQPKYFPGNLETYANMGHDESASTGGAIYASTRFWFRSNLEAAEITADGIKARINVTAEGAAKAAVRDKCDHDVLSASVRLRITCDDISLHWRLRINKETIASALIIQADPDVHIGNINVTFDGVLDPPPPLNKVDDWILTTAANKLRPALNAVANEKAKLRLISSDEKKGDITLRFVDDAFFKGEAAVVMGQLGQFFE